MIGSMYHVRRRIHGRRTKNHGAGSHWAEMCCVWLFSVRGGRHLKWMLLVAGKFGGNMMSMVVWRCASFI